MIPDWAAVALGVCLGAGIGLGLGYLLLTLYFPKDRR